MSFLSNFKALGYLLVFTGAFIGCSTAYAFEFSCGWSTVNTIQTQSYGPGPIINVLLDGQKWKTIGHIVNDPETEARLAMVMAAKGAGWEVNLTFRDTDPVDCTQDNFSTPALKVFVR